MVLASHERHATICEGTDKTRSCVRWEKKGEIGRNEAGDYLRGTVICIYPCTRINAVNVNVKMIKISALWLSYAKASMK